MSSASVHIVPKWKGLTASSPYPKANCSPWGNGREHFQGFGGINVPSREPSPATSFLSERRPSEAFLLGRSGGKRIWFPPVTLGMELPVPTQPGKDVAGACKHPLHPQVKLLLTVSTQCQQKWSLNILTKETSIFNHHLTLHSFSSLPSWNSQDNKIKGIVYLKTNHKTW